ncbi:MAG: hypothetical protein K8R92_07595 [Planctomycetes bacterium]|nr:hypothetical protein [Planctomycetota bacterium]
MEAQILLFGVALPATLGLLWLIVRRPFAAVSTRADSFVGWAFALTLAASALSQESIRGFPTQGGWLWFPLGVLLCALISGIEARFAQSKSWHIILVLVAVVPAALLLDIPEWKGLLSRVLLGIAAAIAAAALLRLSRDRNAFSTSIALSFSLVGASVVAMLSGFAKLAVPIGAVALCAGLLPLVRIAFGFRRSPADHSLGFDGAVVIATVASLGAATGYGYDTSGVPMASWICAALAPLGIALGEIPAFRSRRALSACARITGCAVLSAAAIVLAAKP